MNNEEGVYTLENVTPSFYLDLGTPFFALPRDSFLFSSRCVLFQRQAGAKHATRSTANLG
jgi:hypothetical protein